MQLYFKKVLNLQETARSFHSEILHLWSRSHQPRRSSLDFTTSITNNTSHYIKAEEKMPLGSKLMNLPHLLHFNDARPNKHHSHGDSSLDRFYRHRAQAKHHPLTQDELEDCQQTCLTLLAESHHAPILRVYILQLVTETIQNEHARLHYLKEAEELCLNDIRKCQEQTHRVGHDMYYNLLRKTESLLEGGAYQRPSTVVGWTEKPSAVYWRERDEEYRRRGLSPMMESKTLKEEAQEGKGPHGSASR